MWIVCNKKYLESPFVLRSEYSNMEREREKVSERCMRANTLQRFCLVLWQNSYSAVKAERREREWEREYFLTQPLPLSLSLSDGFCTLGCSRNEQPTQRASPAFRKPAAAAEWVLLLSDNSYTLTLADWSITAMAHIYIDSAKTEAKTDRVCRRKHWICKICLCARVRTLRLLRQSAWLSPAHRNPYSCTASQCKWGERERFSLGLFE